MIEKNFITRSEWNKHIHGNWRVSHSIWSHIRTYVPGWGYSQAEVDAFFEGEDGGKKQVHWDRVTNKPATFAPSAHTLASHSTRAHAELSDAPADAHHTQSHAAEHEVGGGDLLTFSDITGFGDYLDQAVKQASNVQFNSVQATIFMAYGTVGTPDPLYRLKPFGTADESFVRWLDNTGSDEWSIGTQSHQAGFVIRRESGAPANLVVVQRATGIVNIGVSLDTPKLTINGGFYLDTLAANNKVADSDKIDGVHGVDFVRGDGIDNGVVAIRIDDADFKVFDSTDGAPTEYIFRDHSAGYLYLGTAGALPKFRADVRMDSHKLYFTTYYLDALSANNKVLDSNRLNGQLGSYYSVAGHTHAHINITGIGSDQHHAAAHTLASHSTKAHSELSDAPDDAHHPKLHASTHNNGQPDVVNHDSLAGFVGAEHLSLPNSMANVINSGHTKAMHTGLGLMPYTGGTFTGVVLMTAKLEAADHGTYAIDEVVNVCYGTSTPPTPNTTTHGTIFLKYTA